MNLHLSQNLRCSQNLRFYQNLCFSQNVFKLFQKLASYKNCVLYIILQLCASYCLACQVQQWSVLSLISLVDSPEVFPLPRLAVEYLIHQPDSLYKRNHCRTVPNVRVDSSCSPDVFPLPCLVIKCLIQHPDSPYKINRCLTVSTVPVDSSCSQDVSPSSSCCWVSDPSTWLALQEKSLSYATNLTGDSSCSPVCFRFLVFLDGCGYGRSCSWSHYSTWDHESTFVSHYCICL